MKPQNQVTSVELSNKLKVLFQKINKYPPSIFYREWTGAKEDEISMFEGMTPDYYLDGVNCYTATELGNMLPGQIFNESKEHPVHQYISEKSATLWHSCYVCTTCKGKLYSFWAETEVDCRAKMLIMLLENNITID